MKEHRSKHSKWFLALILILILLGVIGIILGATGVSFNSSKEEKQSAEISEDETAVSAQEVSEASEDEENEAQEISGDSGSVVSGAQDLSMHVIDVGQGLSLLFESNGEYLLYDGGDSDYSSNVVSYLQEQGVKTLAYVVASHYDADHLNGVVEALRAFEVENVLAPDYETDTEIYQSFIDAVEEDGIEVIHSYAASEYVLGNCSFTALAPKEQEYSDENDYSIALRFVCGLTSYLVTGDATALSEAEMLESGLEIDSDVYVVGNYGSADSSSQEFLDAVTPDIAVISCGEDNQYGYPSQEVMERLQEAAIQVFRTDEQGAFEIESDGTALICSTTPCNDYSYGESEE